MRNLADLVRLNRNFGGHSTARRLFRSVFKPEESFTVLDVGAASGDTARLLKQSYPGAVVTSLDQKPFHLAAAPHPKLAGDAFQLPFSADAFDAVFCSLFLHHFTDQQVTALLREFGRVTRRYVLVSDLERHIAPYLFLATSGPVFGWDKMTVHDGKISVRAAFRAAELRQVAERAGLENVSVEQHRPAFRLTLQAVKRAGNF